MFGSSNYAFIRRHAIGSTDVTGPAIVDLSKLATAENIFDILSVIHQHLKFNPADCAIHDWPSSPRLMIAVHCLQGIDEIQSSDIFEDIQESDTVTRKQFRLAMKLLWPDVWRWIESLIILCVRNDNPLVRKLTGKDWEDMQKWRTQIINNLMQLTTDLMLKHDSFHPSMLSIDGFTECMVEGWLHVLQRNLESSRYAGQAMLHHFLSDCSPQDIHQHRGKLVRCLETDELKRGMGVLMNHIESCPVDSVAYPLLVFVQCAEVSTTLRRQILPLDPLALVIRVHFSLHLPIFFAPATTTVMMSLRIFDVLIANGSIMWVKNALDNDILLHILRAQRFINNLSIDAVSFDELGWDALKELEDKLYIILMCLRPYTLYPSVLRRISRAIKSVDRLELLEKYGVEVKPSSSQGTIGAAWAILCSEVKINERLLSCKSDYAHQLCASVSCPHKSSGTAFTLLRCSGCQQVFYCSRSCQIIDWKRKPEHLSHKVVCARIIDDRRACIGLPVNTVDLFAASKIALTRTMMDQKDPLRKLIQKFNLSRSQSEEERLDDSAIYCSLVTVRLDCRQYPLKAGVLSFFDVISLYPEEEEQREALLSGALTFLPSGWVDAFEIAKKKDLTLVYIVLPNSSLSRTVVVGPWNARTGIREQG
ncbi:hypothetical protein BT96DRAFT_913952 [Gymnopus androsaceus JB14]|uniref:MYND-type domain-containing protein n=1 Tax=Gymnopus androsaceus JB14 TaxID=1447944 RepID=A0A6A4ICM1_9AGAR|nr:hypothetical protein BT96DRAFT_913952 [Gymnopus androsaceus JB14]